jgi:hypothetical protein
MKIEKIGTDSEGEDKVANKTRITVVKNKTYPPFKVANFIIRFGEGIDKYESFLNQWVRLVPNINRHSTGFENLNTRENLDRGRYNNYGTL